MKKNAPCDEKRCVGKINGQQISARGDEKDRVDEKGDLSHDFI